MSLVRGSLAILGPTVAALLVVTVGAGWALFVDAITWFVAAACCSGVRIPPPAPRGRPTRPGTGRRPARGMGLLPTHHLAVGRGAGVRLPQRHPHRRHLHPGPGGRQGHDRRAGLGPGALGRVGRAAADDRRCCCGVPLQRPLLFGMLGISAVGVPMVMLGADPQLGATGRGVVRRRRRHRGLRHRLEPRHAGEHRRSRCCRAPTPTTPSAPSWRCPSASWPTVRWGQRSATRRCWWSRASRTSPSACSPCCRARCGTFLVVRTLDEPSGQPAA